MKKRQTAKGKRVAKKQKHARRRKVKTRHSLWVYYKNWTPAVDKTLPRRYFKNDGSGCCTKGYRDSSFEVKDLKRAKASAKKLVKLKDVGWVDISVGDDWNNAKRLKFRKRRKKKKSHKGKRR